MKISEVIGLDLNFQGERTKFYEFTKSVIETITSSIDAIDGYREGDIPIGSTTPAEIRTHMARLRQSLYMWEILQSAHAKASVPGEYLATERGKFEPELVSAVDAARDVLGWFGNVD